MTTKDKQKEEEFMDGILGMAKALSDLQDRAVEAYRPLVDDICNRKAKEGEVDHLLTWMFDFVENEQMLLLFKKVCRAYFYTYPETVAFYILEYRKRYDRESLKGTKYEYLLEEDSVRKIGIFDFSTKPTNYYNLDVIISVGYSVKSTCN